jgi:hypothetical protein
LGKNARPQSLTTFVTWGPTTYMRLAYYSHVLFGDMVLPEEPRPRSDSMRQCRTMDDRPMTYIHEFTQGDYLDTLAHPSDNESSFIGARRSKGYCKVQYYKSAHLFKLSGAFLSGDHKMTPAITQFKLRDDFSGPPLTPRSQNINLSWTHFGGFCLERHWSLLSKTLSGQGT